MRVLGNLDLLDNELRNVVLQPATNFPTNAKPGHIIFKEGRVMACVEIANSIPVWIPMTQEITTYVHQQTTASSTWTINHNFNTNKVLVQISDENGKVVIPDDVDLSAVDTATVTFATTVSGVAIVMLGTFDRCCASM